MRLLYVWMGKVFTPGLQRYHETDPSNLNTDTDTARPITALDSIVRMTFSTRARIDMYIDELALVMQFIIQLILVPDHSHLQFSSPRSFTLTA